MAFPPMSTPVAAMKRPALRADNVSASAMMAPALILVGVFILIPAVVAVIGSFFDFSMTSSSWTFVGGANYRHAATDPLFWLAISNNIFIVIGSVISQVGGGAILAAILDRGIRRGSVVYRTIIFMPVVISSIAVAFVWMLILDPNVGPLNAIVKTLGLTPPRLGWLGDPSISLWMLLLIAAWQNVGFQMMLILAGLQAIPKENYEAASLDGARGLTAFWYITLPGIRNVLVLATLITVIGGFKVFDLVFVTTGGGPANATQVLGTYTYTQAFAFGNMGYANAMAVVLLVTAALLGWLQVRLSHRA
ncbi:carbohydrate ABC transporter permease [Pleomorphomonas sp. PLEO]|uniref:carbohydrate ABC transporter permease n=1 Tax=Pleomorphomonas sp. PLEO TaxID=3239306 RepID=UPI00351E3EBC